MSEITARYPLRALFAEFPNDLIAALEQGGAHVTYAGWNKRMEFTVPRQDEGVAAFVLDGRLRVHHVEDVELKRPLAVLDAGRIWLGGPGEARLHMLAPAPRVVVRLVEYRGLMRLAERFPQLGAELWRQQREFAAELQERLYESSLPIEERVMRELKRWGVRQKDGSIVTERLTQEMIAGLVGSCRETVSRIMAIHMRTGRIRSLRRGRAAGVYILEEPKAAPLATAS